MAVSKKIPGQPGRIVSWFRNILVGVSVLVNIPHILMTAGVCITEAVCVYHVWCRMCAVF